MENIIDAAALGGLDDEVVEEAVLHELLMQRVPPLLRDRQFGHFNLNLLSDQEVQLNFRFNRDDLERLRIALRVPNELKTPNRYSVAFHFAESGLQIWFFSPEPFEKLPEVQPPDKQILQLITFAYFRDCKDLAKKLNSLHLWNKMPRVIIVNEFQSYCNLFSQEYNPTKASFISAALLDSASVCSKKNKKKTLLLAAVTNPPKEYKYRLQVLHDIYFTNVINCNGDITVNSISNLYNEL